MPEYKRTIPTINSQISASYESLSALQKNMSHLTIDGEIDRVYKQIAALEAEKTDILSQIVRTSPTDLGNVEVPDQISDPLL